MDSLDRRGQLPRAVWSGAFPEIEHGDPAAHVGERDELAVERLELERQRALVAERCDLERREPLVERIVGRVGRQQREPDQGNREREATA
jgi:hypothetical protein